VDSPPTVVIRPLATFAEREECVKLQEAIWGNGFVDSVPSSILMIAQETGGVASGAFRGDRLIGFVFGITGIRDGRRIHWSDMLAVLPEYRDQGLGHRLKLHQRELLLGHGVERVLWTFDPLVARNAFLNLRRLGAVARTYKRDLYGRSTSPLHAGIGTDRLLAEWWIGSPRVRQSLAGERPAPRGLGGVLLNPPGTAADRARPGEELREPRGDALLIAVPADIQELKTHAPDLALAWRENVRAAFEAAFAAGYQAVDMLRGDAFARYILERRSDAGPADRTVP
jgi:predicted GNAT superfamily acetyltransferase